MLCIIEKKKPERKDTMKFTKMQGIGNDYVYVNCFQETVPDPGEVAKRISDRHFGIGSDGLILIKPSDVADFEMEMYNSDGSLGAMCGNGIRCVAKYVYDYGLTDKTHITVATGSGIKTLELTVENGKVALVKVDMGAPILEAEKIPVDVAKLEGDVSAQAGAGRPETVGSGSAALKREDRDVCTGACVGAAEMETESAAAVGTCAAKKLIVDRLLRVKGKDYPVTCVSMGNPHCVTYALRLSLGSAISQ